MGETVPGGRYLTAAGVRDANGDLIPEPEAAERPDASWTLRELREYAERRGIDLGDATKKADVLAILAG